MKSFDEETERRTRYPALSPRLRRIVANPARTAVFVSVALLVYQACLPVGLTFSASARTIEWRVFPSADFTISIADVVGNVVPYWIFGYFVLVASWRRHRRWLRAWTVTVVGTLAMVVSVEGIELFNPLRGAAIWDVISGAIGAGIAVVTGTFYCLLIADRLTRWVESEAAVRPVGVAGAAVAAYIVIDAAKPFHVISSANLLWDNIKLSNVIPFRPPGADIRDQLHLTLGSHVPQPLGPIDRTLDYWGSQLEVLALSFCLLGLLAFAWRNRSVLSSLSAWAAVVLGAEVVRLGIVHGHADVTHVIVAALSAPIAFWAARVSTEHRSVGLGILVSISLLYVAVVELRPFEFGAARPLTADMFVPLIYHFRDIDVTQLWNLVESVLRFVPLGGALYALRLYRLRDEKLERWPSAWTPTLLCGLVSLAFEMAQLWLPLRTPAIEDVLLAAVGGYVGVSCIRLLAVFSSESAGTSYRAQNEMAT